MALNYLLFAFYLIILSSLLLRVPFIKNAGISSGTMLSLFLVKILAGIAIGWISIHIYGPGNDYWDTNDYAKEEYQLLQTAPLKYLVNIFTSDYQGGYAGMFSSGNSYWNDLKGNIVIKLVSVFNIFSRGNYYINSLFFNWIIFFGHVILFRLFIKMFPVKEILVIAGCFLLPSTLYFTSGIHKDGLVFLMLAVLVYSVFQSLDKRHFNTKRIILIISSLVFLFLLRNFICLALLPALFAWVVINKTKWPAFLVFTSVYLLCGLLFFNIDNIVAAIKPMDIVVAKQSEYLKLEKAATEITLNPLQPTLKSFAVNFPQAANHAFLRPYVWEIPVKSLLPLCIELFACQVLLIMVIIFREKLTDLIVNSYMLFAVFFVMSVLIITGYIVPNLGSLVRYRSIYLPFVITPALCLINWKKIVGGKTN